jgi:hypothetical protein
MDGLSFYDVYVDSGSLIHKNTKNRFHWNYNSHS